VIWGRSREEVAILLATCDGERFLAGQIESILGQDYSDFRLLIRDDRSTDGTADVLRRYAQWDDRIVLLRDPGCGERRLGAKESFSRLMMEAARKEFAYACLADQDDVWMRDKISRELELIEEMERRWPGRPLLVHSDLEVVGQGLEVIAPSFMRYQSIYHQEDALLNTLLVQNFVTGCTVLANRSLIVKATPVPSEALMHDWWLALCAAAGGHIGYLKEPTVKYRQHDGNTVGACRLVDFANPLSTRWVERWREGRRNFWKTLGQAGALAGWMRIHAPNHPELGVVDLYASLKKHSSWRRLYEVWRLGVLPQNWFRRTLLFIRLVWGPRAGEER